MADLTGMMQAAAGAAGGGGGEYIEDVFSTYLYTGNGSTQTITNGIDLDGGDGLVWIKNRSSSGQHFLFDTNRGPLSCLSTSLTSGTFTEANSLTAFNSTGFTLGSYSNVNQNLENFVSWTFRKAPKFFDIVTYTGTGANRTVAHNLGSVPGCIIVKRTNTISDWAVYHRSNTAAPETDYLLLNSTAITADSNTRWNDTLPTDSVFSLGTDSDVNSSGSTYVAYLFAHDAGGFGDDGEQNIISCGGYSGTGTAAGPTVTLGYEPQWVLIKRINGAVSDWVVFDNIRGIVSGGVDSYLTPNSTGAEEGALNALSVTATGFELTDASGFVNAAGSAYIYIAIRRGPMKTPTAGTEVFNPVVYTGTNADNRLVDTSLLTDMVMIKERNDTVDGMVTGDRLRGNPYLLTGTADAENADADTYMKPPFDGATDGNAFSAMNGVGVGNDATSKVNIDTTANNQVAWAFRRAPGFFDVVCYTGDGTGTRTLSHNLGVVPEMLILKKRDVTSSWYVYHKDLSDPNNGYLSLEDNGARSSSSGIWGTGPTVSSFQSVINTSTQTHVVYLFASCPGVSKVGSYTGNGTSVTVTTDFQPRFILVKRTDSTGNWIVGDSARGLVAGDDPFIELNEAVAETTNEDWVDITSSSFTINETTENLNVNAATYIYLCIA